MSKTTSACTKALKNVKKAIDTSRKFPENVFVGDWSNYLFFDSDWTFGVEFVACVQQLFEIEGALCICLCNLDVQGDESSSLYLDRELTPDAYRSMLKGAGPESGWIYGMDRFAFMSEVAEWCIYCERENEISVMATRNGAALERYAPVADRVKAVHLDKALALPLSFGFSGLSSKWRTELRREYANRSPQDHP